MDQVTGLPAIVAKLVVIVDKALAAFATVTEQPISEGCGITAYYVNVTDAGESLTTNLSQLIFGLINYLSEYFSALTSVTA